MIDNQTDNIVDLTLDNVQEIINKSHKQLVVVDFWADWCEPCKKLMPIMEKLAQQYADQLILAKVNADEHQMLAAQFGVRSLPTVMFIKEGQPIDGFSGAQTEAQVRALLQKHLPDPWESSVQQAKTLQEQGQHSSWMAFRNISNGNALKAPLTVQKPPLAKLTAIRVSSTASLAPELPLVL